MTDNSISISLLFSSTIYLSVGSDDWKGVKLTVTKHRRLIIYVILTYNIYEKVLYYST